MYFLAFFSCKIRLLILPLRHNNKMIEIQAYKLQFENSLLIFSNIRASEQKQKTTIKHKKDEKN